MGALDLPSTLLAGAEASGFSAGGVAGAGVEDELQLRNIAVQTQNKMKMATHTPVV